jgi:hypothetical protein
MQALSERIDRQPPTDFDPAIAAKLAAQMNEWEQGPDGDCFTYKVSLWENGRTAHITVHDVDGEHIATL